MNSYHSTTYQIVFGTKYRKKNMIKKNRRKVYQYIYGICRNHGCFVYRINGVSDHLHIVLSIPPKVAASALIKDLKQYSSRMIKRYNLFPNWGGWQTGYFLGTYAASARKGLITYVINQEIHHGEDENPEAESYQEEMIRLLEENNIEWDEKYLE
jgi:REP element-mobilizing transposase RayT